MSYNLFLDDMRNPIDCTKYIKNNKMYKKLKWVIVRSYDEFKDYIINHGIPNIISFDHDLSYEHYMYQGCEIPYENLDEKTGYHCAEWMINYCIDNDFNIPNMIFVHSMNVVGSENIKSLFNSYLKFKNR